MCIFVESLRYVVSLLASLVRHAPHLVLLVLLAPLYGFLIMQRGVLPINDSTAYRNSSSWLVNSEQSSPTVLIAMNAPCLLGCRILDEAFRPYGNWQNGLSKALHMTCPISQHKSWWDKGFWSFEKTPAWSFRPDVPKLIIKK